MCGKPTVTEQVKSATLARPEAPIVSFEMRRATLGRQADNGFQITLHTSCLRRMLRRGLRSPSIRGVGTSALLSRRRGTRPAAGWFRRRTSDGRRGRRRQLPTAQTGLSGKPHHPRAAKATNEKPVKTRATPVRSDNENPRMADGRRMASGGGCRGPGTTMSDGESFPKSHQVDRSLPLHRAGPGHRSCVHGPLRSKPAPASSPTRAPPPCPPPRDCA